MPKRVAREFSREYRLAALRRMEAGENVSGLARELKLRRKLLYAWRDNFRGGGPELDFIENHRASPPRLDVKDCFLPEDFVGSLESKPESSEVSEGTPASAHVGPIEQLEAI